MCRRRNARTSEGGEGRRGLRRGFTPAVSFATSKLTVFVMKRKKSTETEMPISPLSYMYLDANSSSINLAARQRSQAAPHTSAYGLCC